MYVKDKNFLKYEKEGRYTRALNKKEKQTENEDKTEQAKAHILKKKQDENTHTYTWRDYKK